MRYNLDKIRALNPLNKELARYGIEPDRKGFARCPFHNEKTASFKVYSNDTFYCFGCGASGDVISLVRHMENLDFNEACARLDGEISYSEQREIKRKNRESEKRKAAYADIVNHYWAARDAFEENERIIEELKPSSPMVDPLCSWILALQKRARLQYELELAEIPYMRGSEVGG